MCFPICSFVLSAPMPPQVCIVRARDKIYCIDHYDNYVFHRTGNRGWVDQVTTKLSGMIRGVLLIFYFLKYISRDLLTISQAVI